MRRVSIDRMSSTVRDQETDAMLDAQIARGIELTRQAIKEEEEKSRRARLYPPLRISVVHLCDWLLPRRSSHERVTTCSRRSVRRCPRCRRYLCGSHAAKHEENTGHELTEVR